MFKNSLTYLILSFPYYMNANTSCRESSSIGWSGIKYQGRNLLMTVPFFSKWQSSSWEKTASTFRRFHREGWNTKKFYTPYSRDQNRQSVIFWIFVGQSFHELTIAVDTGWIWCYPIFLDFFSYVSNSLNSISVCLKRNLKKINTNFGVMKNYHNFRTSCAIF